MACPDCGESRYWSEIKGCLNCPRRAEVTNDDLIYDIRVAISEALRATETPGNHKRIVDCAVDLLPDFFRQPLLGHDLGGG